MNWRASVSCRERIWWAGKNKLHLRRSEELKKKNGYSDVYNSIGNKHLKLSTPLEKKKTQLTWNACPMQESEHSVEYSGGSSLK